MGCPMRPASRSTLEFLRAGRHSQAAAREAELTVDFFEADQREGDFTRFNYGRALLVAGHLDEAQSIFDALAERGFIQITARGIRGAIAAMWGDSAGLVPHHEAPNRPSAGLQCNERRGDSENICLAFP